MKKRKNLINFFYIKNKRFFNKSQITIFIVLGIVILIMFGLMFFVKNVTSGIFLERKANRIYNDFLSSTSIKEYITDCLDATTGSGLRIIGLQGGRLYDYQISNGYHINDMTEVIPFEYVGKVYNVSYGIRAPGLNFTDRELIFHGDAPLYPYNGSLVDNPGHEMPFFAFYNSSLERKKAELYSFTALCNELGENYFNIPGAKQTCETYSPENESVQEYLSQYITENLKKCINFQSILTPGYNVTEGNFSVGVLVGDENVFVYLNYPINVMLKGKPPITKYLEFNHISKVRLKKLHELALHLAGFRMGGIRKPEADADNIFFDIENDDPSDCSNVTSIGTMLRTIWNASCVKGGIKVTRLRDYCLNHPNCNFTSPYLRHFNYTDLIILNDAKYTVNGMPYLFVFAVENRKPALDYIDDSVSSETFYFDYIFLGTGQGPNAIYGSSSGEYNIFSSNGYLQIFPFGLDPDEDYLIYNYSGWKTPEKIIVGGTEYGNDTSSNVWQDSDFYKYDIYSFGNYSGFNKKGKNANYYAGAGTYVVRITARDNEGLADWQDVKIRVS